MTWKQWQAQPSDVLGGAPARAALFRSLYEVDFTAQATQAMNTAGSYTIDGKTWWAKGLVGTGGTMALTNGVGLTLTTPGTVDAAARYNVRTTTGAIFPARMLCLPLSQVPGYDPSLLTYVAWRLSANVAVTNNNDRCPSLGIIQAAASATAITAAERNTYAQHCHFAFNTNNEVVCGVAGNQNPIMTFLNDSAYANWQGGIQKVGLNQYQARAAAWGGAFITPMSSGQLMPAVGSSMDVAPSADSFAYTHQHAFSDGVTFTTNLLALSVMQPKG